MTIPQPTHTLANLIQGLPGVLAVYGPQDAIVRAPVVEGDHDVRPGGLFVARRGLTTDGHDLIHVAVARGAAAIVGEQDVQGLPIPYVRVSSSPAVLGLLASAYWGHPSHTLTVVGVTGTDGKTTTSHLVHAVLRAAGLHAGLISTIAADIGDGATEDTGLHVTSPGAPLLQALLARMVRYGVTHVVAEVTSHALAQGRFDGTAVDVAVLTNITHEHLDFHGTFEAYRAAKRRLFEMLAAAPRKPGQPKVAVVNADDPNADVFASVPADRVVRYGFAPSSDVRAEDVSYKADGTHMRVNGQAYSIALVGGFNVSNALAALAVGQHAFNLPHDAMRAGLAAVRAVSGRMERIDEGQPFTAIVDFAHTPNALRNALHTARSIVAPGAKLIAVFGSAGLRDRAKRRLMAEVSAQHADFTVLTAEDPRTEPLDGILAEMAEGCRAKGGVEGQTFVCVADRGRALYLACQRADPGDVVIACGKGHEQSMCFGDVEWPWDDRIALRAALRGTPLATLPTA